MRGESNKINASSSSFWQGYIHIHSKIKNYKCLNEEDEGGGEETNIESNFVLNIEKSDWKKMKRSVFVHLKLNMFKKKKVGWMDENVGFWNKRNPLLLPESQK